MLANLSPIQIYLSHVIGCLHFFNMFLLLGSLIVLAIYLCDLIDKKQNIFNVYSLLLLIIFLLSILFALFAPTESVIIQMLITKG
jgi:hypothetical protein